MQRLSLEEKYDLLELPVGGFMVYGPDEVAKSKCAYAFLTRDGGEPVTQRQRDGRVVVWRTKPSNGEKRVLRDRGFVRKTG